MEKLAAAAADDESSVTSTEEGQVVDGKAELALGKELSKRAQAVNVLKNALRTVLAGKVNEKLAAEIDAITEESVEMVVKLADLLLDPRFCERGRFWPEWIAVKMNASVQSKELKRWNRGKKKKPDEELKFALHEDLVDELIDHFRHAFPVDLTRMRNYVGKDTQACGDHWAQLFRAVEDCYQEFSEYE